MKRGALAAMAVALFVALSVGAYLVVFRPSANGTSWIVASYSGPVSMSLGGGPWREVEMKMTLADHDRLRTGEDAEVTLIRDTSQVTVRALTEIEVSQLTGESSRFSVSGGQVYVEARDRRVVVGSPAGARVDAVDAGLGLTVAEDGWTQVQVKRGSADFTAMDHTEHVGEGEKSEASAGRPPSKPVPIPRAILLNVRFPDADTFNSRLATIEGYADRGSRVRVGGRMVPVGADGSWRADVDLVEGINQVDVEATDALGRSRVEKSHPLHVDTTAPSLSGVTVGSRTVSVVGGPQREDTR